MPPPPPPRHVTNIAIKCVYHCNFLHLKNDPQEQTHCCFQLYTVLVHLQCEQNGL